MALTNDEKHPAAVTMEARLSSGYFLSYAGCQDVAIMLDPKAPRLTAAIVLYCNTYGSRPLRRAFVGSSAQYIYVVPLLIFRGIGATSQV